MKLNELAIFPILTLLLFSFEATAQSDSLIYWQKSVKIAWVDFHGEPVQNGIGSANTSGTISYSAEFQGDSLVFTVACFFNKNKSWVIKGDETNDLLQHEQLHFDIFELYARKIRKQMYTEEFDISNLQTKMEKIFNEIYKECFEMQNLYDKQTDHSIIKSEQRTWNNKVASDLIKLKGYSGSTYKRVITW